MLKLLANPKFFPTIMIVLSVGAAAISAYNHDWRRTIYWMAASILTASVTY